MMFGKQLVQKKKKEGKLPAWEVKDERIQPKGGTRNTTLEEAGKHVGAGL